MRKVEVCLMDSFAEAVFGGNVAGVVTRSEDLSLREMRCIASELAAPTTGFVTEQGRNDFVVRFFTSTQEINMCGHVIVGVFSALADQGRLSVRDSISHSIAHTAAGKIPVAVEVREKERPFVRMTQNSPSFRESTVSLSQLAGILRIGPEHFSKELPVQIVSTALWHLVVPVRSLDIVSSLSPDFPALAALGTHQGTDTVNVFSLETVRSGSTVHGRDFCPTIGNPEESASGTTSGAVASYLVHHGVVKNPDRRVHVTVEQGFEMGRPSIIHCDIGGHEGEITRVEVGGSAVRSLIGEIMLET